MRMKLLALAGGLLLLSAGAASAAPGHTTTDLNLRNGPGTGYAIIDTMPEGARVHIRSCGPSWCRVGFHGTVGYAAKNLLSGARDVYAYRRSYAPAYAYRTAPAYVDEGGPSYFGPDYDDGPGLGYAYAPGFSIGFGFGSGWDGD